MHEGDFPKVTATLMASLFCLCLQMQKILEKTRNSKVNRERKKKAESFHLLYDKSIKDIVNFYFEKQTVDRVNIVLKSK